ncbi:MAG: ABC transporter permease [Vicinamibacterales bacterium]|jgi:ABC-type transport system involved in multi-copper enzyme maturation permease subunit|nr:ABC transporter permease [Vicinamibacterales bacterium]
MSVIPQIALQVFRESVRDKVFYNLVLFAVLLIAASYLIGQLTAGQEVKIIKDLGLGATQVFGLFIAVFIGIGLVSKEVERRSIYSLLAKPVRRHELILGKYAGLVLTLAVNIVVMAVALYAVLGYMSWVETEEFRQSWEAPATDPAMLLAIFLIFAQLMLVTAIALFFSTFSGPILAAVLTFGLVGVGHFNADLRNFENVVDSRAAAYLARALYYGLPNLAPFDVKAEVVHAQPVSLGYVALTTGYAVAYIAALLLAAMFIFSRRDFR